MYYVRRDTKNHYLKYSAKGVQRWVKTVEEAEKFQSYDEAQLAVIRCRPTNPNCNVRVCEVGSDSDPVSDYERAMRGI